MRSTEARIIRLEDRLPKSCDTCRDWKAGTLAIVFRDASGAETSAQPGRPDACPNCGRSAPPVNRNVIVFGCRWDGPP